MAPAAHPEAFSQWQLSTDNNQSSLNVARIVYAACLATTAMLVAHENFVPSAEKARLARGIEKIEQETFLRKLTTGLVGAPSEAELLRIAARTVSAVVPDARGAIIVFPTRLNSPRVSGTDEDECDSIPFSGWVPKSLSQTLDLPMRQACATEFLSK